MNVSPNTITLSADVRDKQGKQVHMLRRTGQLPAVLYGHGTENKKLVLDYKQFERAYKQAGSSSLVDLVVAGHKPVKVLIQEVQADPVSGVYLHADFHQVRMTEKIHAEVNLNFIGESKAVKEMGGILVKNLTSINVECLPQDLVHEVSVDIETLKSFNANIRVKDLKLPATITVREKGDEVVVMVQPPRSEEELKSLEEKVEEKVEEVEVVAKPKEETEEGEAGAATPVKKEEKEKKKE